MKVVDLHAQNLAETALAYSVRRLCCNKAFAFSERTVFYPTMIADCRITELPDYWDTRLLGYWVTGLPNYQSQSSEVRTLQAAFDKIETEGTTCHHLVLYKPGRNFVKAAKQKLTALRHSNDKLELLGECAKNTDGSLPQTSQLLTHDDLPKTKTCLTQLIDSALALQQEDIDRTDSTFQVAAEGFAQSMHKAAKALLFSVYHMLKEHEKYTKGPQAHAESMGDLLDLFKTMLKKPVVYKLTNMLDNVPWNGLGDAITQAQSLLLNMPTFITVQVDTATRLDLQSATLLQSTFADFTMVSYWADLCVGVEGSDNSTNLAAEFTRNLKDRWYTPAMQDQLYQVIKNESGISAAVTAFKACFPPELSKGILPTDVIEAQNTMSLQRLATEAGDFQLVAQVRFLNQLLTTSNLLNRMRKVTEPEMDKDNVSMLVEARIVMKTSSSLLSAPAFASTFKAAGEDDANNKIHFNDLDGFLDPVIIGQRAEQELQDLIACWCKRWSEMVMATTESIEKSCPEGVVVAPTNNNNQ